MRIEYPDFTDKLDPKAFLYWLNAMEDYFKWYEII